MRRLRQSASVLPGGAGGLEQGFAGPHHGVQDKRARLPFLPSPLFKSGGSMLFNSLEKSSFEKIGDIADNKGNFDYGDVFGKIRRKGMKYRNGEIEVFSQN